MAISQDKAQELSSTTEWNTLENTFSPRIEELTPAVLKKQANRVRRFLDAENKSPQGEGRVAMFEEALQRLEAARGSEADESDEKLAARREKEKAAKERNKSVRDRRSEVKTKLEEKAAKEKLEKEGEPKEGKEKKPGKGVRANLQAASRGPVKTGMRKV